MPTFPEPQFAQLSCGTAIVRFGWLGGLDIVSVVFFDSKDCHGTETMTREGGRQYWKQLRKAGYKIDETLVTSQGQKVFATRVLNEGTVTL